MRTLEVEGYRAARRQLSFHCRLGDLTFFTSYWYCGVDFPELEARFGKDFMKKVYAHGVAFELNKLASLRLDRFDLGPLRDQVTPDFRELWQTVFHRVWAQWRYEHGWPDVRPPELVGPGAGAAPRVDPTPAGAGPVESLLFCGGGKDSLVAGSLLDRAEIPYDAYAYAHSVYGRAAPQLALIDRLLDHLSPRSRRRHWVYDDFMDASVLELRPDLGVRHVTAAETPSSLFGVVPVALTHGYRYAVLAHERSADVGNLKWDATGEDVNHQWGKSTEAERLLGDYLDRELLSGFRYFSILKPVHDVIIFGALRRLEPPAVAATHSCNVAKPWCKRCPKCAYVWLGYMAMLDPAQVDAVFGENLFDLPDNQLSYCQMLGLEEHTPFECIGQIEEARLFFELCRRKGLGGAAMDRYLAASLELDVAGTLERFAAVAEAQLPPPFDEAIRPLLEADATEANEHTLSVLGWRGRPSAAD